MKSIKVGIIGGSGLDDPDLITSAEEIDVYTPYGRPSSNITVGKIDGVDVAILARHGKKHTISPSKVNNRANIWALKELGCTHILATTACGSLQKEIEPGHLILPSQFIDKTTKRHMTFYDQDEVQHVPMHEPFCNELSELLSESIKELGIIHHRDRTVITIEGPKFSTRAESRMHIMWGAHVVNMSTVPECVLAREMGLCYQPIAMSTDYDCFMEDHSVTWEDIQEVMKKNADNVKAVLKRTIPKVRHFECTCKGNTPKIPNPDRPSIRTLIRTIPDFPKKGIMFRDITTLLQDKHGLRMVCESLVERYRNKGIDVVAGIEARGFILGGMLAKELGTGFVMVRKKGKLPYKTHFKEYELEYGAATIEIHTDAIQKGQNVLIVDDLLATGGTCLAACSLINELGGEVKECACIVDLPDLGGRKKLDSAGFAVHSLVEFEGE